MILTEYNEERHIKNEKENSYKEGYEDGEAIGQKRGEERGIQLGEKRGRILASIEIYRRIGWTDEKICQELLKEQEMTEQEVRVYLEKEKK